MAKYSESEEIRKAAEKQAQNIREATDTSIGAINVAGDQQIADIEAAQSAWQQANATAQELYQQQLKDRDKTFYDVINSQRRDIKQADAEALQRITDAQKAARWTGATELAASIANLIGVGGANAVSQQYKTYSQDWMQKADRDLREHRSRIDNMRERQRALQMQLAQLRQNDAAQALSLARQDAAQALQARNQIGQARYNNAVSTSQLRMQGAKEAGNVEMEGVTRGVSAGLQRRGQDISAQQHRDSMNMQAARYGLKRNKDGTYSIDKDSEIYKLNSTYGRTGSTGSRNRYFYKDADGNRVQLAMTSTEHDDFIEKAIAVLNKGENSADFNREYNMARDDMSKKSVVLWYAEKDPELRSELNQYRVSPEYGWSPQDQGEGSGYQEPGWSVGL